MNADTLYCLCKKPYENTQFMIECDVCKDWFHGSCVNISEKLADDIEYYHCPECQLTHGPIILKKKRIQQRYNNSNNNNKLTDSSESKTGSLKFLDELKQRTFPSADNIPLVRLGNGSLLCEELLESSGFDAPILVTNKQGLQLRMPPEGFGVEDVEQLIGSDREVDVIDVAEQENVVMSMHQWTNYYNDYNNNHNNYNNSHNNYNNNHNNYNNRNPIYNLISLEFSNTRLAEIVSPPQLIHHLSWNDKFWPRHQHCLHVPPQPSVQRYCLMSVADSFTDFHIDFGGSSVWYHIFKGEKIFYLIRPTPSNLVLYERWLSSSNQTTTFFADQVDTCYILSIKQGQTILIPTGWIHAVLTPTDSLVFGGNFLTHHNIPTQLKVYEIERRVRTDDKFLFPRYETLCWYAGHHFLRLLTELSERGGEVDERLGAGIKALVTSLKAWTSPRNNSGTHDIPPSCSCLTESAPSLIRELHKKLKTTAPYLTKSNKNAREQVKKPTVDRYRLNYRRRPGQNETPTDNIYPIRLRLAGGKISEYENEENPHYNNTYNNNNNTYNNSNNNYNNKYDDDDDDALVVDERSKAEKIKQQHRHPQQHNYLQQHQHLSSDLTPATTKLKAPYASASISNLVTDYDDRADNNSQCSMRDAIQGMLSMSQMDASQNSNNYNNHNYHTDHTDDNGGHKSRPRYYSDDIEEELNSCYKDDNFVYPSVASSDSEDGGKVNKKVPVDEAWNPKAGVGRSSRRSSSTRNTRTNGMARKNAHKMDAHNVKNYQHESLHYSEENYHENNNNNNNNDSNNNNDNNVWNEENNNNNNNNNNENKNNKSYNESLVERIHDMHNYSSNSYYGNKKPKLPDYVANASTDDNDDVDLSPKKEQINFMPHKNTRVKKTPTTAKQRLAHKLKLNKDFF